MLKYLQELNLGIGQQIGFMKDSSFGSSNMGSLYMCEKGLFLGKPVHE